MLIKATLKNDPWIKDLEKWLQPKHKTVMMSNIKFISYDAYNAAQQLQDAVFKSDQSKNNFYIIDEAHNFIRNVYQNIVRGDAEGIYKAYKHIQDDLRSNRKTKLAVLSATPAINQPFELGVLFNLMRAGTFPESEGDFLDRYVSNDGVLRPDRVTEF